jgi:hypothetical protein
LDGLHGCTSSHQGGQTVTNQNSKSLFDQLVEAQKRIIELENEVNMKHTHHVVVKLKNELNQANDRIKTLTAAGDIMEPYATEQSAKLWAKAKETK